MPRIRSLKPRFWDSPDTAKADLAPRLLFMAMWNWADDSGRGTANLKELEAFAFPNDDVTQLPRRSRGNSAAVWRNFAEVFWEAVQCYGVDLYEVGGRRYYEISSFRDHQSKNFRADSSLPGPADGKKWDLASEYGLTTADTDSEVAESPPDSRGISALSCRTSPLDRDEDRDRDEDEEPPYPPDTEPSPDPVAAKQTGSEKALARFESIPGQPSALARQVAVAYSESGSVPIEPKLLREVAGQIDSLLQAHIPPDAIELGLDAWTASDSFSPKQIPNYVHKANNGRRPNGVSKPTVSALDFQAAGEALLAKVSTK